jgi:hypothetical protein
MGLHHDQSGERLAVSRRDDRSAASRLGAPGGGGRGFTKTYGLKRLVYFEEHETVLGAVHREQAMKRWLRAWKVRLIMQRNPEWDDLYDLLM